MTLWAHSILPEHVEREEARGGVERRRGWQGRGDAGDEVAESIGSVGQRSRASSLSDVEDDDFGSGVAGGGLLLGSGPFSAALAKGGGLRRMTEEDEEVVRREQEVRGRSGWCCHLQVHSSSLIVHTSPHTTTTTPP